MIPEDIVTKVTINREVKVRGEPTREVFSTIFDLENVFIINSHILAELRKKLKNKMILGTTSTHKEATYGKSLPWSSRKYVNKNGGTLKYCQWATFLIKKR